MEIRTISVDQINPATYNPRKDLKPGDRDYEKLARSIEEFGYVEPLVWNERTGNLVGGHQRFKILVNEKGAAQVDVSVVNLDPDREKALNIALNKISGDWDYPLLKDLLLELDTGSFDIEITGFDESEIAVLMGDMSAEGGVVEDDFDAVKEAERISEPRSMSGSVWRLGRHRLMCGDSTSQEIVRKLMDGHLADMVFTDPPYNVDYTGGTKDALKIENDKMGQEEFYSFLLESHMRMFESTKPGSAIYVCHADTEGVNFRRSLVDAGFLFKQCIVWVKDVLVMGRQDHHWKHEPILYGWKPGSKHRWYGGRKQTTVFEDGHPIAVEDAEGGSLLTFSTGTQTVLIKVPSYEVVCDGLDNQTTIWKAPKPIRNGEHPTMKPIVLCAKAIGNSSRQGDVILDLFGGSGSTLMACEQTDRVCYTMELDPVYCDVIVNRWEKFTGQTAVLVD